MEEAARLCDRLVILDHGRILVEGRPVELIRRYVGTEVLEVAAPAEPLRRFVLEQGLIHESLGQRLIIYGGDDKEVFRQIISDYCREGCTLRPASLEDVFLRLTGRELRE